MSKPFDITFPYIFNLETNIDSYIQQPQSDIDILIEVNNPSLYFTLVYNQIINIEDSTLFDVIFGSGSNHPLLSMKMDFNQEWIFDSNSHLLNTENVSCSITKSINNSENLSSYTSSNNTSNLHSIFMEIIADIYFHNPLSTEPIISDTLVSQNIDLMLDNLIEIWDLGGDPNEYNNSSLIAKRNLLNKFIADDPNPTINNGTLYLEKDDKIEFLINFECDILESLNTLITSNIQVIDSSLSIYTSNNNIKQIFNTESSNLLIFDSNLKLIDENGSQIESYTTIPFSTNAKIDYDAATNRLFNFDNKTLYVYDLDANNLIYLKQYNFNVSRIKHHNGWIIMAQDNGWIRVLNETTFIIVGLFFTSHGSGGNLIFDVKDNKIVTATDIETNIIIRYLPLGGFDSITTKSKKTKTLRFYEEDKIISIGLDYDQILSVWGIQDGIISHLYDISNTANIQNLYIIDSEFITTDSEGRIRSWNDKSLVYSYEFDQNFDLIHSSLTNNGNNSHVAFTNGSIYALPKIDQNFSIDSTNNKLIKLTFVMN